MTGQKSKLTMPTTDTSSVLHGYIRLLLNYTEPDALAQNIPQHKPAVNAVDQQ